MREIQTAENKTLKLTNVVSRRIQPEEFNNMQIVLTQMHNFIKSNGAQPLGPLVQCIKLPAGPNPQPEVYMMQQATQLIPPAWRPATPWTLCSACATACTPTTSAP